jgi:hypothetical protein
MRIWSIHPAYLDWKGLGALWREALLAQKVVQGKTKGWKNHPQLSRFQEHPEPLKAVGFYLKEIFKESKRRDYNYNLLKILKPVNIVEKIGTNLGQLEYEFNLLQSRLKKRTPLKYIENLKIEKILPHPLFLIRKGPPEPWEKAYWREK